MVLIQKELQDRIKDCFDWKRSYIWVVKEVERLI